MKIPAQLIAVLLLAACDSDLPSPERPSDTSVTQQLATRTADSTIIARSTEVWAAAKQSVGAKSKQSSTDSSGSGRRTYPQPYLDTTVVVRYRPPSHPSTSDVLTVQVARDVFYRHFERKGYLNETKHYARMDFKSNQAAVLFDTIFLLGKGHPAEAVVDYWVAPYGACGHCYQPHYALVVRGETGPRIIREEFIPDNFSLTEVRSDSLVDYVSGVDYDCSRGIDRRRFQVRLRYK